MSARWETVAIPPKDTGPAYIDAVLTPHRSLSGRAFLRVLCVFSAMNLAVAIYWTLRGAWPVLGFLVLDVALFCVAFHVNYRASRAFERVRVAADVLHVTRQPAHGAARHWVVSPAWARVEDRPDAVRIAAGDRAMLVGAFLSPPERGDLAIALRDAIARARNGRPRG
ncbi:MAG: DUF2244 domain-containing protein [Hyphomonadaceae bacterium]|nr:MAG: hypothetical protein FD160_2879 [Caulobacteraceae bacterium]MBT9444497.1 DUF2244 domain-containing protein [Hyphomonadaceae bacterium]TPW07840.1 MAG: hypothetical protein FD124_870 [Alphaproteobacteria bacterium]